MSFRDLLLLWILIAGGLAYLDVDLHHALWFSTNILIHGAIGSLATKELLRVPNVSLFIFCGPGLITGGALAVLIFHVLDRGPLANGLLILFGMFALLWLTKGSIRTSEVSQNRFVLLSGLSALLMSSEFAWLVVSAIGCIIVGALQTSRVKLFSARGLSSATLLVAVLCLGLLFREKHWWLITDDYQVFEVISQHVTEKGPFALWGSIDFSRYHWLSYGWSGLLDQTSGHPEQLVTLSRVMPLVYSLIFGASLLVVCERLTANLRFSTTNVLPAIAVASGINMDWSAPSTAGAFAVCAGLIAIATVVFDRPVSFARRVSIYLIFSCIVALTKLPTVLVMPAVISGVEFSQRRRLHKRTHRLVGTSVLITSGGVIALLLLQPMSLTLGEFRLIWTQDNSQWLIPLWSEVLSAVARNSWMLATAGVCTAIVITAHNVELQRRVITFLLGLAALFPIGILMNVFIVGSDKANLHEYFSGPNYTLATFAPLALTPLLRKSEPIGIPPTWWLRWTLVAVGIWGLGFVSRYLLDVKKVGPTSLRVAATDSRSVLGIVMILAVIATRHRLSDSKLRTYASVFLIVLICSGIAPTARQLLSGGFNSNLAVMEMNDYLGSSREIEVGRWLDKNTNLSDRVATNLLFDSADSKEYGDDFALAMWSRREFIVIGPKFFGQSNIAKEKIDLSIAFANSPNLKITSTLKSLGVRWFVVDIGLTTRRHWEPFGTIRFRSQGLWVVELTEPSDSTPS